MLFVMGFNLACFPAAGHLDGSLCLWDMRQSRAGSQPLFEARDVAAPLLSVVPTANDSQVLTAAKDNVLRLYDFRCGGWGGGGGRGREGKGLGRGWGGVGAEEKGTHCS